jgi:hypothetical protein
MWPIIILLLVVALFFLARSRFEIRAEIMLNARMEDVWQAIIAMDQYHRWNTQLAYLGGEVALGSQVKLKLSVAGADPYEFTPTINHWQPQQTFGWIARTGLPYVFDGEHYFELQEKQGQVWLINREVYSGILTPVIRRQPMMKNAPAGFEQMNEELKQYLDSKPA